MKLWSWLATIDQQRFGPEVGPLDRPFCAKSGCPSGRATTTRSCHRGRLRSIQFVQVSGQDGDVKRTGRKIGEKNWCRRHRLRGLRREKTLTIFQQVALKLPAEKRHIDAQGEFTVSASAIGRQPGERPVSVSVTMRRAAFRNSLPAAVGWMPPVERSNRTAPRRIFEIA